MAEGTPTRTVAEVMSAPPVTAVPSETLANASGRMRDRGVGSVIVVDGERPIGILTERDLVRFAASGADASGTKVSEWMTEDPDRIGPDVFVQEAFASLASHGYRHIPVVEGDRLVGVVSMRDLMKVAQIQPVVHPSTIEAPPGLEGVIVAETSVGDVRGLQGFYHYRQYNAVELADKRPLEDVWFLLFDGRLPTRAGARGVPRRDRAVAPDPGLRTPCAPGDRASVVIGDGRPAHRAVAGRLGRRDSSRPSTSLRTSAGRTRCSCARSRPR